MNPVTAEIRIAETKSFVNTCEVHGIICRLVAADPTGTVWKKYELYEGSRKLYFAIAQEFTNGLFE